MKVDCVHYTAMTNILWHYSWWCVTWMSLWWGEVCWTDNFSEITKRQVNKMTVTVSGCKRYSISLRKCIYFCAATGSWISNKPFLLFVIVITLCVSGVELPEAEVIERVVQIQSFLWVYVLHQHGALHIKFTFLTDGGQQLLQSKLRVHSQNCLLGPFIVNYQTYSSLRDTDVIKLIKEVKNKWVNGCFR